ncbi:FliA/WhiG family RNA polymerase sigma factor [bacterium]|nr:FliA/WhiG family RNA polymerase sigma factor [bacterium]
MGQREPVLEQLVIAYRHLVDYQVQRLLVDLPASVDRDDLVSEACIGLIDAINRYDPNKQVKFETYASIRIRGAIVDYLRKLDWAPRSLRQRAREIGQVEMELEQDLGLPPSDEQVAQRMGLKLTEFRQTLSDISVLNVLSFRDLEEGEGEFQLRGMRDEPEDEARRRDFVRCLAQNIDQLPDRERLVLDLYYRRQLSLKEIGDVLDLSESRICQIHSGAVVRLRGLLRDWQGEV